MADPYLPDIMRDVVSRIDYKFNNDFNNDFDVPFGVFFDCGNYSHVARNIYKLGPDVCYPLVWLVMPFTPRRGYDYSVYAEVSCQIILAMPTDKDYTQTQRDELIFKPRLIPIYVELMKQISEEPLLDTPPINQIKHEGPIIWPYWGGGDVNSGGDTKNYFGAFIDAIEIKNLQLKIRHNCLDTGIKF